MKREKIRSFVFTSFSQLINQIILVGCGFLILRQLSVSEYALYTIVTSLLGMLTVISDGGVNTGLVASGGRVWKDFDKLGSALAAARKLRNRMYCVALVIALPASMWFLHSIEITLISAIFLSALICANFFVLSIGNFYQVVPKLHQDLIAMQRVNITASFSRLILTLALTLVKPTAVACVVCAVICQTWASSRMRALTDKRANKYSKSDPATELEMGRLLARILPGALFYAFSGQISIFLAVTFGSTEMVAQLGALSRLGAIVAFFSSIFTFLIVPRFARYDAGSGLLLKKYIISISLVMCFCLFLAFFAYKYPKAFLWLLGEKYFALDTELFLSVANACFALISTSAYQLNSSRGGVLSPIVTIPVLLMSQIVAFLLIGANSLSSILLCTLFASFMGCLMEVSSGLVKWRTCKSA